MSENSDHIDLKSGVVDAESRNESNGVIIDQSGNENETLINRSDQGFDGVRVFGEENEVGEGLRVQLEGLDGEIDLDSCNLEVVDDLARNEVNGVGIDQSGNENETLMQNRSDQGLVSESIVDGVRVLEEGNEVSEGLRVQLEGLDVEIDLDSCNLERQMGFSGYNRLRLNGELVVDLRGSTDMQEESVRDGITFNYDSNVVDVNNEERVIEVEMKNADGVGVGCDALVPERRGDKQRMEQGNAVEGADMKEVLGGKNESVPDGITVKNDSIVVNVELKNADGIGVGAGALVPERRGDKQRMEEEGKFYVSDLVWGKVRSHPWWPGKIFEPSAASNKAMKYFKKDSYLIAYFGDQTFAWNEASSIKPFRMYFSQMEKQSNSERFCHAVDCALDEVARRVEFGLACPCLQEETREKMKSQIAVNAGIQKESSMRIGGDNFSDETSLNATKLVTTLKSVAAAPHSGFDRLSFVLAKAQLAAFNSWKGYYQLPVIEEFSDLSENDNDVEPLLEKKDASDVASEENSDVQGTSSTKRPRRSGVDEHLSKKEKSMSILMYGSSSGIPNYQKKSRGRTVQMRKSISSEKRYLTFDSLPSDLNAKRRKNMLLTSSGNAAKPILKSTDRNSRRTDEHSEKFRNVGFGDSVVGLVKPEGEQLIPEEFPSPTEMLSKLYSAARDPMNAYSILMSQAGLFCDYRNLTCSETTKSGDRTKMTEEHIGKSSSNSVSAETLSLEGIEDSYWTDRIIQCNPKDQVLFDPKVQIQEDFPNAEWEISPNLDSKQEVDGFVGNSERESLSDLVNGNSEYSPTALILNFSDLESVPPIADLNIIFSQYGPLYESETQLIHKSKRTKLVFKRRDDAETAFSKSGKFSIFGPSLISYRLEYSPSPRKASWTSKRKRKYAASINVNGVRN